MITPAVNGEFWLTGVLAGGGSPANPTINSGFTIAQSVLNGGFRATAAYLIQSNATALSPQWQFSQAYNVSSVIATFK
jgi:hypothetical protein